MAYEVKTLICAPLVAKGEPIGVVQVLNKIGNLNFVTKLQEHDPERVPEELVGLLSLAQKALRQVRTLLFDLRPVVLETQGLVPALRSYVERQQQMGNLSYHLRIDGFSGRLVAKAERAIFGIVQEAVSNVKRHAQAQNVWIVVVEEDNELQVAVRDDGRGFDLGVLDAEYDRRGSLGMINMRERAREIDGRLSIQSQPGTGTTMALIVALSPLRE